MKINHGILLINIVILLILISLVFYLFISTIKDKKLKKNKEIEKEKSFEETLKTHLNKNFDDTKNELKDILLDLTIGEGNSLASYLKSNQKSQIDNFLDFNKRISERIDSKLNTIDKENKNKFEEIKKNIDAYFDDKVTKEIKNQFENIKESMDKMTKGMIQFETIQDSVTSLNKVFSNSKTIGNFGEFNLEQIFENQFPALKDKLWFKQVSIDPSSSEKVDFTIHSTFVEDGIKKEFIIPIDCKFPFEKWAKYLDKEIPYKEIEDEIRKMAKSISSKYIKETKNTTPFAILYLPSEAIYLTVIKNFDFVSKIFNEQKILIQGPSTIMAFVYNILIKNQNFMFSKHMEEIKDLFIGIQRNYKYLNDNLSDSYKFVNKASKNIEVAHKHTIETMNKINKTADILHINKVAVNNKLIEDKSNIDS